MLTGLDYAAAYFLGSSKECLERFAVTDADSSLKSCQILRQSAKHFQDCIPVGNEDIPPHNWV